MLEDREESILGPHGGYRDLAAYQMAQILCEGTVAFCARFFRLHARISEQMMHAARSCKQDIVEGSMASGTSRKTELKLVGIARASLEELLEDYCDFLRQRGLAIWEKQHPKALYIRKLCYRSDRSYMTYRTYIEDKSDETAANTMICLIHQTAFLLDRLKRQLDKRLVEEGGITERIHRIRSRRRDKS